MNLCTSDWAHWDAPQFKGVQRPTQRGQSLYVPLRIKAGEAPSLGVEKRLLGRRRVRGFSGSRTTMPTAFRVPAPSTCAMPKSSTFTGPLAHRKTLAGLRSR